MWLQDIRIKRFGIFQDVRLDGFAPGPNLVLGPNEAGKTTLMAFIRAMFFGLKKDAYPALGERVPGGSLTLVDKNQQTWRLERWGLGKRGQVRLTGPTGRRSDEEAVRELLRGTRRVVYENVFAFGLSELQTFDSLKDQEIKHRLYSASLGLGPISLSDLEKKLDSRRAELFKVGGRTRPRINIILNDLKACRDKIRQLQQQPAEYQDLRQKLRELEKRLEHLATRADQVEAARRWQDKLILAWEDWQTLLSLKDRLQSLPEITDFPASGLERLEALKEKLAESEQQWQRWERESQAQKELTTSLRPDPGLLKYQTELRELIEERHHFVQVLNSRTALTARREAAQTRVREGLQSLGSEWDADRIRTWNPSLAVLGQLKEQQRILEGLQQQCRLQEERLAQAQSREQETHADHQRARRNLIKHLGWGLGIGLGLLGFAGLIYYFWRKPEISLSIGVASLLAGILAGALEKRYLTKHYRSWLKAKELLAQTEAEHALEIRALKMARQHWQELLDCLGLPSDWPPAIVFDLIAAIKEVRRHLEEHQKAESDWRQAQQYLEDFARRHHGLCQRLNRPAGDLDSLNQQLGELKTQLDQALVEQQKLFQSTQQLQQAETEQANWKTRISQLEDDLRSLLKAGAARDEEDFRQRAMIFAERHELQEKIANLTEKLRFGAGGPAAWEVMQPELATVSPDELHHQAHQLQEEAERLRSESDTGCQRLGEWQARRDDLARSEELSQALFKEQMLITQLQDLARDWAIATLFKHFLERGREVFEREHQPEVLKRATAYFATLTGQRYQQVFAPLGSQDYTLFHRDGSSRTVTKLSRGTAEQLYLALRFALVQEYSQQIGPLPLILDDILVNFDTERARQAVRLLGEMGRTHQLLIFTCHHHIVDLIQEELGPVPLQDLWSKSDYKN